MQQRRLPGWLPAAALLLVLAVFLFQGIDWMHMRADEELTYRFSDGSFQDTLWRGTDTHPPLWWAFFWGWRQAVGVTEVAGRVHAVLFTLLTLALIYQLGRAWFGARRFGLFAMVTLALNAFFFTYTMEIRPYPVIMLLAVVSMGFFHRWLGHQTRRAALFYGLSVAAMLYVHYHLAFLVIAQIVYALIFHRPLRRIITQGALAMGVAFLVWLPWLPGFINQIRVLRSDEGVPSVNEWGSLGLATAPTRPSNWETVGELAGEIATGPVALWGVLLVVGLVLLWRRREYWLALMWVVIPPALVLLVNTVVGIYLHRYVSYVAIGAAVAMAATLAALPKRINVVALVAFALVSLWVFPDELPQRRIPYRTLFQGMTEAAQPGDVVLFDRAGESVGLVQLNMDAYLDPTLRDNIVPDVETARDAPRIWYVTGDWFNEDVRAHFRQIEETHRLQLVLGDCKPNWCYLVQLLEAPPRSEPVTFGGEVNFWGAEIDAITEEQIQLRLWWRVDDPPDQDYSIGVHLLDANGALVAQHDGPVQDRDDDAPTPTSQLGPGYTYIDPRTLDLPPDLPPGDYELVLLVYQWWDDVRLTLPDGREAYPLATVTLD